MQIFTQFKMIVHKASRALQCLKLDAGHEKPSEDQTNKELVHQIFFGTSQDGHICQWFLENFI